MDLHPLSESKNLMMLPASMSREKSWKGISTKGFSPWIVVMKEMQKHIPLQNIIYTDLYLSLGYRDFNHFLVHHISKNFDVIFIVTSLHFTFDFNLLKKMKKMNPNLKIVFLETDSVVTFPLYTAELCKDADLVIPHDTPYNIETYRSMGTEAYFCFCIPLGKDRVIFEAQNKNLKRDIDISFVGSNICDRKKMISDIESKGFKIKTYGRGFSKEPLSIETVYQIFRSSKITLNFSKVKRNPLYHFPRYYRVPKQLKGRLSEIILLGKSFCLTEYCEGLEKIFEIGKEIVCFYDEKDLFEKVQYYLYHEQERESIAQESYQKALKDIDISVTTYSMLQKVNEIVFTKNSTPLIRKHIAVPKGNYVGYHLLLGYKLARQKKIRFAFQELYWLKYGLPSFLICRKLLKKIFIDYMQFMQWKLRLI